jgi:hypothetical protein
MGRGSLAARGATDSREEQAISPTMLHKPIAHERRDVMAPIYTSGVFTG